MKIKLWVRQEFDAAHSLEGTFPSGHQCARLHGHRYEVTITLAQRDDGEDVLVDYHEMHAGLSDELAALDHRNLNDVLNCPTTCENLARWLWKQLAARWPALDTIEVKEQSNTGCVLTR